MINQVFKIIIVLIISPFWNCCNENITKGCRFSFDCSDCYNRSRKKCLAAIAIIILETLLKTALWMIVSGDHHSDYWHNNWWDKLKLYVQKCNNCDSCMQYGNHSSDQVIITMVNKVGTRLHLVILNCLIHFPLAIFCSDHRMKPEAYPQFL